MKLSLFSLVFFGGLAVVLSALAFSPKVPGKPGDCWTEQTGPLRTGQEYDVKGLCQRASCGSDGVTIFASCGAVAGPDGRLTNYDYSKPYPECCPHS